MHYLLANETVRGNAIKYILEADMDSKTEIIVQEVKQDRSQAQRRLGHMWHGEVAKQTGHTHDQIRNRIMLKLAVPIFYRDRIQVNGVYSSDTIDVIRNLKTQGMQMEYQQCMKSFVAGITTNSFTVKQNKEFLDSYQNLAISEGWGLTVPDELRFALD